MKTWYFFCSYIVVWLASCLQLCASPFDAEAYIRVKSERIIVSEVNFENTPLSDAIDSLKALSVEYDDVEEDPKKKGIDVRIGDGVASDTRITLQLKEIPFDVALAYAAELANATFEIQPLYIELVPKDDLTPANNSLVVPNERDFILVEAVAYIRDKLDHILVEMENDQPFHQTIDLLRRRSKELDDIEADPARKGINIVVKPGPWVDKQIEFSSELNSVPLHYALSYIANFSGCEIRIDPHAVVFQAIRDFTILELTSEGKLIPDGVPAMTRDQLRPQLQDMARARPDYLVKLKIPPNTAEADIQILREFVEACGIKRVELLPAR